MRSCKKNSLAPRLRASSSGISIVHWRSDSISSGELMSANFSSARSRCSRADSIRACRVCDSSGETRMTFDSSSKRSNESVHGSTCASPRTPCALRMTPTAIRLVKNIEDVSAPRFLSGSRKQRANGAGRPALTADHFSEVGRGDLDLDDRRLVTVVRPDSDGVGIIHERFGDELDELFHFSFLRRAVSVA